MGAYINKQFLYPLHINYENLSLEMSEERLVDKARRKFSQEYRAGQGGLFTIKNVLLFH